MNLTITGEERDALYGHLVDRLGGIGDIPVAIDARNFGVAERIGREYADELRFLLDDLGLGERGADELVELTSPPDVLRRVLPRLERSAKAYAESLESEAGEVGEMRLRGQRISDACTTVLDALGDTGTESDGGEQAEPPAPTEAAVPGELRVPTEAPRMSRWRRILPRAR